LGVVSDVEFAPVESAQTVDGGTLPPGWWFSKAQVVRVDQKISSLEQQQSGGGKAFLIGAAIGVATGFVGGVALTVFVAGKVPK
jgi:hypothetical protein